MVGRHAMRKRTAAGAVAMAVGAAVLAVEDWTGETQLLDLGPVRQLLG
jgi:hypothetical protein